MEVETVPIGNCLCSPLHIVMDPSNDLDILDKFLYLIIAACMIPE